jgi:uncharacterized membrane protein
MLVRLQALAERVGTSLWAIPLLFVVASIGLAALLLFVDASVARDRDGPEFIYGEQADSARATLSAIASAMLTFTGLVFTVTMLVLQLAASQLSPGVLSTFLRDRGNQVVLGLFVATLVFALVVLRSVREEPDPLVPSYSVWAAIGLLLASVGGFIYYIDHMAKAIKATSVMDRVAREAHAGIDRLFPEPVGRPAPPVSWRPSEPPSRVVRAPGGGVLSAVDQDRLLRAAAASSARVMELVPMVGEHVPWGGALFRVWSDEIAIDEEGLVKAIILTPERTTQQDAAFGFRRLVDLGLRALSPSVNDPTTAVQAIERIHDLLRHLLERQIPAAERLEHGTWLVLPRPDWEHYVRLGTEELAVAAAGQRRVTDRLVSMLDDLLEAAPPERQPPLRRWRERVASPEQSAPGSVPANR